MLRLQANRLPPHTWGIALVSAGGEWLCLDSRPWFATHITCFNIRGLDSTLIRPLFACEGLP